MKTIEEFIRELGSSETLQNELKAIKDKEALGTFLKKNDCGFTAEEFGKALKAEAEGEITDETAVSAVSGGLVIDIRFFGETIRSWFD